MNVLFIERDITKASPLKTLAKSIEELGTEVNFIDISKLTTKKLIHHFRKANAIVIQYYGEIPKFDRRQLAIATVMGVPIIRNWAGSDALNVITKPGVKRNAQAFDKLVTANLTFSHMGLVNELGSANISCEILPKIVDFDISKSIGTNDFADASVLVYLPSNNRVFYGADYVSVLIEKYPNVHFTILADDEHAFAHHANVSSLGWVSQPDMLKVWDKIGLLLRITEHDGFPRMILEGLGRGKYVIHNNSSISGVWFADNQESIEVQLNNYLNQQEANNEGIAIFEALKSQRPNKIYNDYLKSTRTKFKTWLNAARHLLFR